VSPPRQPRQARAFRRRDALLEAAARILHRDGWDGLTTRALAHEAGAAIGTVYTYFESKDAVLEALLARYEERLAEAIDRAFDRSDSVAAGALAAVDAFADVWLDEPGYRELWLGAQSSRLQSTGAAWARRFETRVARELIAYAPSLPPEEATLVARTAVALVSGLLLAAVQAPEPERAALIHETRLAVGAYLEARLGGSSDQRGPGPGGR
jgi:AcrR family transcriptional regulator